MVQEEQITSWLWLSRLVNSTQVQFLSENPASVVFFFFFKFFGINENPILFGTILLFAREKPVQNPAPNTGNVDLFQVFEMAPSLYMIEVQKAMGDTLRYHKVKKRP